MTAAAQEAAAVRARLHEIAYRDSAVSVTVRAEDLRAILAAPVAAAQDLDPGLYSWLQARGIAPDSHDGSIDMDEVVEALNEHERQLLASVAAAPSFVTEDGPCWRHNGKAYIVTIEDGKMSFSIADGAHIEYIGEAKPYAVSTPAAPVDLHSAARFAADVLAELYAKYQSKIGPFASQAQLANVRLGDALRASTPAAPGIDLRQFSVAVTYWLQGLATLPCTEATAESLREAKRLLALIDASPKGGSDERKRFEAWALSRTYSVEASGGVYDEQITRRLWSAWQAALQATSPKGSEPVATLTIGDAGGEGTQAYFLDRIRDTEAFGKLPPGTYQLVVCSLHPTSAEVGS